MANTSVMEGRRAAGGSLLDGVLQDQISGEVGWQQKSYPLGGDGTHALVWVYSKDSNDADGSDRGWVYSKDSNDADGSDRGWVDYLQWTPSGGGGGSSTTDWEQITYTYDPSGRRIAKDVDGEVTKYVYDGDQCIAEYDANDVLLRKYIHGPCIDEPICMVEGAGGYAGTYYYHFDALGSVVALSDADGDTVQVYEYDVYGQVAASDPNHPNRFMFTGREFDAETGLYYYRARYYNPAIGRFLQTDPIQYGVGLNAYTYCLNSPVILSDPTGLEPQLVHNEPGWIYDQWEREEGHAAVPEGYGPFYQQQHKYSCAGVAILNLWLMYDRSPWAGQMKSDLDAEEWVLDRLEYAMGTPGQDWDKQGTDNMWTLAAVAQVSGVGLNVETYRHRTAAVDGILTALSAKKAVIIEMTLNVGTAAQCRHAVLLTPTPLDWVEDGSGKYTLVDSATYFVYGIPPLSWDTLDDLRKWLNALVETHADSDTGYNRLERSIAVAGSPVVQ